MHLFDRAAIGDEVWAELEELLISADVGVNTTGKLIEKVRQQVAKEKITQGSLVRTVLKAVVRAPTEPTTTSFMPL